MATSKSGSKAKTTATKKASTKKPVRRTASTTKVTTKTVAAPAKKTVFKKSTGEPNYPAIIIAEVIGTFILTSVALLTMQDMSALYIGLAFAVAVLTVGAVSGAHINPAVTFGLWTARKLKTALVPVYWIAQFVGAILAILVLGMLNGAGYPLDFAHFGTINWGILAAEVVGTAVFLFGFVAITSNQTLSQLGKAFGLGLSLTIGLLVAGSAITTVQTAKYSEYQSNQATQQQANPAAAATAPSIPSELFVKGATLNPAVALATTEHTESQLSQLPADSTEKQHSRLGLEVIIGTLIGAALGANLYLLLAYVNRQQD